MELQTQSPTVSAPKIEVETSTFDQASFDQAIAVLAAHKQEWARLPIRQKITMLDEVRRNTARLSERWVNIAVQIKRLPSDSPWVGEEWISGPWAFLAAVNGMIKTLTALADGHDRPLKKVRTRANGQVVVDTFPLTLFDHLLLNRYRGEVWMQPGVTPQNLNASIAVFYKQKEPQGSVVLVLGAGNITSIAPLDILYKLVAEGQACLLKMNPVNEALGPVFEEIFAPFIAAGYLRFVYGGGDVGAYLTTHPQIDAIHMTGSSKTHDAIVYGTGAEGAARKAKDEPINTKPMTSELGGVCPTIVIPGPWSAADLRYQAEHLATQRFHNSGFNCVASQVLVLPSEWALTPALLDALRAVLRELPPRPTYYPGAADRQRRFAEAHPGQVETFDNSGDAPRTLITGLDPNAEGDLCYTEETFGPVYATTHLPGKTAAEFLEAAVLFANERLEGTLGANILVHPQTMKELGPALERAIADLRYGTVGVNAWTGVGYLTAHNTWGAFPGHTRQDVQSGVGVVHNAFLFDKAQKSVVYQPFFPFPRNLLHGELHLSPKPAWFVTHRQAQPLGRRLAAFEANPSWLRLPRIFIDALRG